MNKKENKKGCHPEEFLFRISSLFINDRKAGGPEQKHLRTTRCAAFTLIELLVVVLIIGILAAIALPQYRLAVEKSRAMEAVVNLRAWHNALERYRLANGSYPTSSTSAMNDIDITLPSSHYFTPFYYYNATDKIIYIAYKADSYWITQVLKADNAIEWLARGLGCNTTGVGTTTDLGAKICKSLCGKRTLTVWWGQGQYGCSIKY